MIQEIITMALGNGLWAALFCYLFLYMLRDAKTREQKYTQTIYTLTDRLGVLEDVAVECAAIKAAVVRSDL